MTFDRWWLTNYIFLRNYLREQHGNRMMCSVLFCLIPHLYFIFFTLKFPSCMLYLYKQTSCKYSPLILIQTQLSLSQSWGTSWMAAKSKSLQVIRKHLVNGVRSWAFPRAVASDLSASRYLFLSFSASFFLW